MISSSEIETFTSKRKRLGWRLHAIILGWAWMTMMAMAIVQVPLVGIFRDFAARWKWVFGFSYTLAAGMAIDYVVRWIAPDSRRNF